MPDHKIGTREERLGAREKLLVRGINHLEDTHEWLAA